MVIAGAHDAARAGPHFVGWTCLDRGGKGVGDQPRGGHSLASSIFTQHTIRDLRDHDLTTVSLSDKPGALDLFPLSADGDTHVPVLYCI